MNGSLRAHLGRTSPKSFDEKTRLLLRSAAHLSMVWFAFACASTSTSGSPSGHRRFGQWSEARNLGEIINSPFVDSFAAIAPNGSLYLSSNRAAPEGSEERRLGGSGQDIYVARRSPEGGLEAPVALSAVNSPYWDALPNIIGDGRTMYFSSVRPNGCGMVDNWVSTRSDPNDDFGWGEPTNLGCVVNGAKNDNAPNIFRDPETGLSTLLFVSDRAGTQDPYWSRREEDGSWTSPVLIAELTTPYADLRGAIRQDGLELIFYSDRPGGLGAFDLWVTARTTTTNPWGTPINLGPSLNTASQDRGPALSTDGLTIVFSSDRPGGLGGHDLYVSTRVEL